MTLTSQGKASFAVSAMFGIAGFLAEGQQFQAQAFPVFVVACGWAVLGGIEMWQGRNEW